MFDFRGGKSRRCPQHGFAGGVPLQAAANARDLSGIRRDAVPPRQGRPGARGVTATRTLRQAPLQSESSETLDPRNWADIRPLGHRMLDDMLDYAAESRHRPVWRPRPDQVRARFHAALPLQPSDLGAVYPE